jgi:hypothetical protein
MHEYQTVKDTLELIAQGKTPLEASIIKGIKRRTIYGWLSGKRKSKEKFIGSTFESIEDRIDVFHTKLNDHEFRSKYSYLLGQYLGDGHIIKTPRSYKLSIYTTAKYLSIIDDVVDSMNVVVGRLVNMVSKRGCTDVHVYSNVLPNIFPQHGPGKKHNRNVELTSWQKDNLDHASLLKGLFHSDGCYYYSQKAYIYNFVNCSLDIIKIYESCLIALGIEYKTYTRKVSLSRKTQLYKVVVTKKEDVIKMYGIVGEKDGGNANIPKPHYLSQKTSVEKVHKPTLMKPTKAPYQRPTKIVWPSNGELECLLYTYPATVLARFLGVSDRAIAKRCKRYNIDKPDASHWWSMTNEQILEIGRIPPQIPSIAGIG